MVLNKYLYFDRFDIFSIRFFSFRCSETRTDGYEISQATIFCQLPEDSHTRWYPDGVWNYKNSTHGKKNEGYSL